MGVNERNSETYVATPDGIIVGTRSVIRIPEAERWDKHMVENIKGTPANPQATDDLPTVTFASSAKAPDETPPPIPRRMAINGRDLE